MPDGRLNDGSRLFDHLHGGHATEIVTPDGPRILIRPDGYIAHIGTTHFAEYAGEPTREIRFGCLSPAGARAVVIAGVIVSHSGRVTQRLMLFLQTRLPVEHHRHRRRFAGFLTLGTRNFCPSLLMACHAR